MHWRDGAKVAGARRVGLSGGQGTGKTTLARLIEGACSGIGLRACVLALDDYYLPRAERLALAARVHPLFETRGPPGTHDVARLREDLGALAGAGVVEVPVFDKGRDDRVGTRSLEGPFELVVLEGWCVGAGASPEAGLCTPFNALERDEDRDGRWRRASNEALASSYAALFARLDELVYLRPPDLDSVRRWRLEQEAERPAERRMDAAAIERFVAHYERITEAMRASLPDRLEWTIELARDHSIAHIVRRGRERSPGG
ncbi:MAG: kinase [Deltaproteobacteria bacterium]|nr:kinase [Deltaproteobacteria bacterium]